MAVPSTTDTTTSIQAGVLANDWRKSVDDLAACLTADNECYSSGEIAAFMRTQAPTLKFGVRSVGEHLRTAFWAGTLPQYDDGMGGRVDPVQSEYRTVGSGRTPAGQPVYVYGPDQTTCDSHDFEVDIPAPPGVKVSSPAPVSGGQSSSGGYPTSFSNPAPTPAAPTNTGTNAPASTIQPIQQGSGGLTVTVIADKRILVPRSVIEAYLYEAGRSMRSSDPVYVLVDTGSVTISLDAAPSAQSHTLQQSRGRLLFGNAASPFQPGTTYQAQVTKDGIIIDF
jgi:hypothetical protein